MSMVFFLFLTWDEANHERDQECDYDAKVSNCFMVSMHLNWNEIAWICHDLIKFMGVYCQTPLDIS